MRSLPALLSLLLVATTTLAADPIQPDIRDGAWHLPFRYWSELSPVLEGTGGFDFLCEVQQLGEDVRPKNGPFQYKTGILKVLEVLHADHTRFPAVKSLKTLHVSGCHGLKVGDRVIVFVDGEPYEGGYVIDRHRGTNCLIGHRLDPPDKDAADQEPEDPLINLVRKGRHLISGSTTPAELRLLTRIDPSGVAETLIRDIEKGRLIRRPEK